MRLSWLPFAAFFLALVVGVTLAYPSAAVVALQIPSATNDSYQEGFAAVQRGDFAAARKAFESALQADPQNAEAHNMLGWVLLKQGEIQPAIVELQNALRLKASLVEARINLSSALVLARDAPGAVREAQAAVELAA